MPPTPSQATSLRTFKRVTVVLAVASLLAIVVALGSDARSESNVFTRSVNCGSFASPSSYADVGSGYFWECKEAHSAREGYAGIALGATAIFGVVALVLGRSERNAEREYQQQLDRWQQWQAQQSMQPQNPQQPPMQGLQ
ncbi:hypothetical protein ABH922_002966 [Rhodococcus sp. 27YEA15]